MQLAFAEDQGLNIADVRDGGGGLPDVAVSSLSYGTANKPEFKIDTSEHDIKKVQAVLSEKFAEKLQHLQHGFGEPGTDRSGQEAGRHEACRRSGHGPPTTRPPNSRRKRRNPRKPKPEAKPAEETAGRKPNRPKRRSPRSRPSDPKPAKPAAAAAAIEPRKAE